MLPNPAINISFMKLHKYLFLKLSEENRTLTLKLPLTLKYCFNAFLPKHSHRLGMLNVQALAHDQIKRYFARCNELERQRERTV